MKSWERPENAGEERDELIKFGRVTHFWSSEERLMINLFKTSGAFEYSGVSEQLLSLFR